ncbi:MAG: hypothetical protein KatS3mg060_1587 [Dehalococcoidia bacterium]|nr:MAG: hypothetical protein KatS3mg060_1587 [Dehalococcoidia bacterium]
MARPATILRVMSATPAGTPRQRSGRPFATKAPAVTDEPSAGTSPGEGPGPVPRAPLRDRLARLGSLLAAIALVVVVHLWIVSGGRWSFETNPSGTLYAKQAAAFRAGQLSLLERPPEALLALPDPYDGRAWLQVMTTPDLSLFGNRFYLYFGPFPALLLAGLAFTGASVADGMLGLAFDLAMVPLFAAALALLRRVAAPDGSWLLDRLLLLSFGLAAPVLFMLGRLNVYETAIAGGQALMLLGLVLGLTAANRAGLWLLPLAGLALGAAAATRLSLFPALAALAALITMIHPRRREAAVALLLPIGIVLALLGTYNAARFGSPFETGLQYAITTLPHRAWLGEMFAVGNLPVTLAWYGWRPPEWSWAPPFVLPHRVSAEEWPRLQGWYFEPWGMTGLAWFAPLLHVGLAAAVFAGIRRERRVRLVAGLALAAAGAAAPILLYRALYWRYYVDFLPLALLAAGVALHITFPEASRRRLAVLIGIAALTLWSVVVGVATGIAARNAWAGFAERDGLVAQAAKFVPPVAAVADALDWIGRQSSEATVALIAAPLPGTPATIDIGTPAHVDVRLADPAADPCWALLPGPGVAYLLADKPVGEPIARFETAIGPPVIVSRAAPSVPRPIPVLRGQSETLCPVRVDEGNLASFGADFVRRYRSRAFRVSGSAQFQPVAPSGPFVVRVLAYGIPSGGAAPRLSVEVSRESDSVLLGVHQLTIDQDYFYRWYEVAFPSPNGPVVVTLRYDDDGRFRPWWAISLARLEVAVQ